MRNTSLCNQTELINRVAYLLEELKNGNKDAFSELYDVTAAYIILMIHNSKVAESDQEDLLQEIYCSIYTSVGSLQHCQAGLAWIKRIANNKIVDYCRKKYKEEKHLVHTFARENVDESDEQEFENNVFEMPEDVVDSKETQRIVRDILLNLPYNQYHILWAFYFDDMKISEIAQMMEMSENTVKTNLRRAKQSFKERVEQLQKQTGVSLREVPIGFVLFLIFSKEESVYASVLVGRELVASAIGKIELAVSPKTCEHVVHPSNPSTFEKKSSNRRVPIHNKLGRFLVIESVVCTISFGCGVAITSLYYSNQQKNIEGVDSQNDMESDSQEGHDSIEAFEKFISDLKSIKGEKTEVTIALTPGSDGESWYQEYFAEPFSEGNLGYCIGDFDQDGEDELFTVDTDNGRDVYISIYEYRDGQVLLTDQSESGTLDVVANDLTDTWIICENEKYILQEYYAGCSAISDWYTRAVRLWQYEDGRLVEVSSCSYDGSSIDGEEGAQYLSQLEFICETLNVSPKYEDTFKYHPKFSKYLKHEKTVAKEVTNTILSEEEIMEKQEQLINGDIERYKVAEGEVK